MNDHYHEQRESELENKDIYVFSEFNGKKFNVIYADPAWSFNSKKSGGSMKSGASQKYDVMTIEDLKNLPVQDLAADNCLLVMWWVGAMPQEAIDLVHA